METKYIKMDFEETLEAKKQLLFAELNIIKTAKRVRNYKILRKRESTTKNKLKIALKTLKTKINLIKSDFPQEEMPQIPKTREKRKQELQEQDIKQELQEIQDKLARLQ